MTNLHMPDVILIPTFLIPTFLMPTLYVFSEYVDFSRYLYVSYLENLNVYIYPDF